jgi:hypothetical protein
VITSIGVMKGRKGERNCRASWFYEMEEMFFFSILLCSTLYVDFIELISKVRMD